MMSSSSPLDRRRFLAGSLKTAGFGVAMSVLPWKNVLGEDSAREATPMFKYAMCNETFGDWPFEKAFALVAEAGYKGIEIAPFTIQKYVTDISAERRREIRRLAEKNGLEIIGLHWLLAKTEGFHLTTPDAGVRRKTAEYFAQLSQLCADLGGNILVIGSPKQRDLIGDMTKEQGQKNAAEILLAALPTLEKTNVTAALEPLTQKETNFMNTAADAVEIMKLVDSPRCRLHLDCKAMTAESIPTPNVIRKYRNEMFHFHANDPNMQGPGFGDLDFVPIMQALADVNYRGWVSVEVFDYKAGPERLTRESIDYMKKCAAKVKTSTPPLTPHAGNS